VSLVKIEMALQLVWSDLPQEYFTNADIEGYIARRLLIKIPG
jgi:hypothetical protein